MPQHCPHPDGTGRSRFSRPQLSRSRGGRLSVKARTTSSPRFAATADLQDDESPPTSYATPSRRLVRGRTDLVIVAERLVHARLETTRAYNRPTQQDAIDALQLLYVDP